MSGVSLVEQGEVLPLTQLHDLLYSVSTDHPPLSVSEHEEPCTTIVVYANTKFVLYYEDMAA